MRRQVIWKAIQDNFIGVCLLAAEMSDEMKGVVSLKTYVNALAAHPQLKLGACAHLDVALYKLARRQLFATGWTRDKIFLISPDGRLVMDITIARYAARAWRILFVTSGRTLCRRSHPIAGSP